MSNPLLDAAVAEHSIPPWPYEAAYDRIIVYSLPEEKATRKTAIAGGLIELPPQVVDREQRQTPRGVIVSAGLGALDVLKAHGMDLGHVVWVARLSPWRHEVDRTANGIVEFLFLRVGDVVGSETLLSQIKQGKAAVSFVDGQHVFSPTPRTDPPDYVA